MDAYKIALSHYKLSQKIPPGSDFWRPFNASFSNREIETDMLMQAVYDGRSITTWHKNNWRHSDNFVCGQHIGLDFDTCDQASSIAHLVQDKFILRYGAFVYTTMSHTDEAPRARAIFVLDQPIMQAKNYALAASALLWLFGTADKQCRDAARFFYGSQGCKFEYMNQVLPLEVVKKLIGQYQETGHTEKRRASRPDYHAPASQQEVADALAKIPAWGIDYDEWLQVLMGIQSEFGEDGFQLAESWADGRPGKNGGPSEVELKWRSFKPSGNVSGVVTIATVFGIAKRFGWKKESGIAV